MRLHVSVIGHAVGVCLLLSACSGDEAEPASGRCDTTADCSVSGQICIDNLCADPEGEGGTGGTTGGGCRGSEAEGDAGAPADAQGTFDVCVAQCEDSLECPDVSELFDCRANCVHTIDLVEGTSCHAEWDRVLRCGGECGACALCSADVRDLQNCFQDYCDRVQDTQICNN